jgi:hypothetical protein
MAGIHVTCPHCSATLNFNQAAPAGTTLTCLICNRTFTVQAAAAVIPAVAKHAVASTAIPPVASVAPPRATAAPPRAPAAQTTSVSARPAPPAKSPARRTAAPQGVGDESSPVIGRVLGGVALAALVLVMLAGLGYLLWTNVLADRLAGTDKGSPPEVVVEGPRADKGKGSTSATKDAGNPAPKDGAVQEKPSTKDGEIDIADLPKKKDPPPPVVEPVDKPDREKKVDPPQPIPVPVVQPPIASGVDAERIEAAIANGVKYLKEQQKADGTWPSYEQHSNGLAALAGLALLEAKVPVTDPVIQRVAERIRSNGQALRYNYDASLAILFLDRLGDPKDRQLIQTIATRLVATQTENGGWSYELRTLSAQEIDQYNGRLRAHWPWSASRPRPAGYAAKPTIASENKDGKKTPPAKGEMPPINLRQLPVELLVWNRGLNPLTGAEVGDNSNTQFAVLGLWTARRYDIAAECPLLLSYYRFVLTQSPNDAGWAYGPGTASTNTMTCAGLLALGVGSGIAPGNAKAKDPAIDRALNLLAQSVGNPSKDPDAVPEMQNMYFLWSVERVGVLFDLKTIGGKDWYAWGAQILVKNQHGDGHWVGKESPGGGRSDCVDTCFALLFLKRANLLPDLTEHLRLQMVIRDPGGK